MPRIDPLQLLTCLSVLLSPEGGISSQEEVPRLVNLMSKFSKKLVSKCVYILILKNSKSHLVNMFMAEGGWNLIQSWLQDAMQISNWNLVNEILALLLITPVDVERLKLNNIPKLVKNLSRRDDLEETQKLSSQLVQHWLVIVKSSNPPVASEQKGADTKIEPKQDVAENHVATDVCDTVDNKADVVVQIDNENNTAISTGTFYKVSVRDGKQIISKLVAEVVKNESEEEASVKKSHKSSSSSSKRSSSSSSSSRSSSSKHRSGSSNSKSSSSKDKSRDKDRRDRDKDKDRHRSNGSLKSSSKSSSSSNRDKKDSKDSKEKQAEKDKDTLTKIKPQSIDKLGRIPKKPSDDKKENKEVKRKPTMSIQERKSNEERPKTVKVFNSKMRSTGLEEEVKPPPPRPLKKPSVQLPTIPTKRPSPSREAAPPEKKIKVELPERPGSIKLIPPKPKPAVLQESDIFMDALTASATAKKEPKKRKRRPSLTKETPTSPTTTGVGEQPTTNSSTTATSPLGLKNIAPINFYQDTLTEEASTESEDKERDERNNERCVTPTDDDEDALKHEKIYKADGVKGVLLYTKKKGPKRSIQWKNDADLVEVRYFELDETERVNVTKTFMDMAKMEMTSEREALQMSRKLPNEDLMEPQTMWRLPFLVDQPDALVQPGSKSLEKDIQFAREKSVLQALYFDKRKIPDSPDEPMPENHQMSDPVIIPLEDADSQEMDLRNTPWPEPKGSPPHIESQLQPQVFQNLGGQFNANFPQMPPPAFQGIQPRFNGPGSFVPPNIMPNGNMMGPNMGPPHDMLNAPGQNIFGPGGGPDGGGFPNENTSNFPLPFNPPNNNMNMNFMPPNNFNMNRPMMNRGGFRRGGGGNNNNGPWVRMSGPGPGMGPNWNRGGGGGHHRGGGGGGGRICKNIKNHGYCRNRDNCPFVHP